MFAFVACRILNDIILMITLKKWSELGVISIFFIRPITLSAVISGGAALCHLLMYCVVKLIVVLFKSALILLIKY